MDKRNRIREEVDLTLKAMDRMQDIEAGPYFYTRLEARLNSRKKEIRSWLPGLGGTRVLRPVMLSLLLLVNLVSAVFFLSGPGQSETGKKAMYTYVSELTTGYYKGRQNYDTVLTEKMTGINVSPDTGTESQEGS